MKNFKLVIQYDGGRYKGWQRLGNSENTIQGKLEYVLSEFLGETTEMIGSSRTDAGVHALAQVANFKTEKELSESEVKAYFNHYLPQDICVREVSHVPESFHARYHAKGKTYLYQIWNQEQHNPFLRKYSSHIKDKLDVNRMKQAAQYFIGEHDFTTFSNAKTNKKSMVREIYAIRIEEREGLIQIRVRGNGFLYNMVRKMVGTLLAVGRGELSPEAMLPIIASKERNQSGWTAEACGLILESVEYSEKP